MTALLAVTGALAATSCATPEPAACPGDRVATLRFQGVLDSIDGGCPFASDAGLAFTATLAYTGDDTAALCVERADAQPLVGTRSGDHVVVAAPATAATVPACTCAVQVTETVEGDLQRDGGAVAFTGELRDALAAARAADPATCALAATDGGPPCTVPCEIHWQLTGSP